MNLVEKIKLIERVDSLIRRKGTGPPRSLATRLGLSERTLYNLISLMKELGAPIYFCRQKNSFCYENEVEFSIGFTYKGEVLNQVRGGKSYAFSYILNAEI